MGRVLTSPREPHNDEVETRVWRQEQLEAAGCPRKLAYRLANTDEDLHRMEEALKAGCPPDLMRAIFT